MSSLYTNLEHREALQGKHSQKSKVTQTDDEKKVDIRELRRRKTFSNISCIFFPTGDWVASSLEHREALQGRHFQKSKVNLACSRSKADWYWEEETHSRMEKKVNILKNSPYVVFYSRLKSELTRENQKKAYFLTSRAFYFDPKNPPPPGGVLLFGWIPHKEPGGRGPPPKKQHPTQFEGLFLRGCPLPPGSWYVNHPKRRPPRGGFLGSTYFYRSLSGEVTHENQKNVDILKSQLYGYFLYEIEYRAKLWESEGDRHSQKSDLYFFSIEIEYRVAKTHRMP